MGLLQASCAATAEALSDRLDDELRGLRRLRIASHLARCGRCREALSSLARLVRTLGTIGDAEPVEGGSVVDEVLGRIRGGSAADGNR